MGDLLLFDCVAKAAEDGVATATTQSRTLAEGRQSVIEHAYASVTAIRLLATLPEHPMVMGALVVELLEVSKPTACKGCRRLAIRRCAWCFQLG